MKKISIIGVGKVAKEAIKELYKNSLFERTTIELVLVGSGSEESLNKIKGFLMDLDSYFSYKGKNPPISVKVTNDYSDIKNSDIVITSFGKWASPEQKELYKESDPSGRMVQSLVNKNTMGEVVKKIKTYSPNAIVGVVTNQVDLMTQFARTINPNQVFLGIGNTVDRARMKISLWEQLKKIKLLDSLRVEDIDCTIVGFHNSHMIPLKKSISIKGRNITNFMSPEEADSLIEKALKHCKSYGARLSNLQKDRKYPQINTGASLLPGIALSDLIGSVIFKKKLLGSFNTVILDEKASKFYQLPIGSAVELPLVIKGRSVQFDFSKELSQKEKTKLGKATLAMKKKFKNFLSIKEKLNFKAFVRPSNSYPSHPTFRTIDSSSNQSKPAAVIFDLSSTILDSYEVDVNSINKVLAHFEKPLWQEGTRKLKDRSKSMKDNFPNFFGESHAVEAYKMYVSLLMSGIENMSLMDGAIETMLMLREQGIKCFVVSNREEVFIKKCLDHYGLGDMVDDYIGAGEKGYSKPNPKIATDLLSRNNIDPNEKKVLFVGDSMADITCADRSGCVPILITQFKTDITEKFLKERSKSSNVLDIKEIKNLSGLKEILQPQRAHLKSVI